MVKCVLADQAWADRLTAEDMRGLTPLFWAHVVPFDEVRLDMGRGVRKVLARYTRPRASPPRSAPHTVSRSLFTRLKAQGIKDALIQPSVATPPASPWRSTPAWPSPTPSSAATSSSTCL